VNKTTQSKGKYDPDYIKHRFIAMGINIVLVCANHSMFWDANCMKFKRHLETQMHILLALILCIVGFVVKLKFSV